MKFAVLQLVFNQKHKSILKFGKRNRFCFFIQYGLKRDFSHIKEYWSKQCLTYWQVTPQLWLHNWTFKEDMHRSSWARTVQRKQSEWTKTGDQGHLGLHNMAFLVRLRHASVLQNQFSCSVFSFWPESQRRNRGWCWQSVCRRGSKQQGRWIQMQIQGL